MYVSVSTYIETTKTNETNKNETNTSKYKCIYNVHVPSIRTTNLNICNNSLNTTIL